MGASGRVIDIAGLQFAVHRAPHKGRATRPVFVIVHGIGSSHRYGRRLQNELALHGEALSLDLPGFGGMSTPRHPLSVEVYAGLVARLFDTLHLTGAVVIGHSMGSQIVTELALQRPELVTHLVLVGPVVDPRRGTALQQGVDLGRDSLFEPVRVKRIALGDVLRAGVRWFGREVGPMLAYPMRERLARVAVPVLVVRGMLDPIARHSWCADLASAAGSAASGGAALSAGAAGSRAAKHAAGVVRTEIGDADPSQRSVPSSSHAGRLVEVPGHRHVVHLTAAQIVAASILNLLRTTEMRRGIDSGSGAGAGATAQ